MSEESAARPVRLARPGGQGPPRTIRLAIRSEAPVGGAPEVDLLPESRPNVAACRRAVRLAMLYAVGITAVYAALIVGAFAGPSAGSAGSTEALVVLGLVAVVLVAGGVVFALGAAPRRVELGTGATVIVGRFGRRYRFPGRDALRPVVLRRFPAGWLTPAPVESVEIAGGSSRRSFLLDEGLLDPGRAGETVPAR